MKGADDCFCPNMSNDFASLCTIFTTMMILLESEYVPVSCESKFLLNYNEMTTFFTIAFVGRSGSSFLQGLIDNHPDAQCLGELFWDKSASTETILDNSVHSTFGISASGFKLGNMHAIEFPEVRKILEKYKYKAIHLTRENRVDQYISMVLAMKNNMWRCDAGDYRIHDFLADASHMEKFLGLMEEHDELIRDFIGDLPVLDLSYESLVKEDGYYPVLDFLGLERQPLVSEFKRQRSNSSQRKAILNYDDMVHHFADTSFAKHFVEA